MGDSRCDDWADVEFEVVVDEGPLSAEHRFAALVYACIFFFHAVDLWVSTSNGPMTAR